MYPLREMIPCGNKKQLKKIYLQQAPRLIVFARKFVDYYTAEDIVHDVFLKFCRENPDKFDENGIAPYLYRLVKNACFDHLKHHKVEESYVAKAWTELKMEEIMRHDSYERNLLYNERINAVHDEIKKLPPRCREIFTKAYLEGEKHTNIAEELKISVRTVETQVYKALKIIRDNLTLFLFILFLLF